MAKSKKPAVIEYIFNKLFDEATNSLTRTVVTSDDIQDAKREVNRLYNLDIKENVNPFNFMKDIVRGRSAGKLWPEAVRSKGYVGEQLTGDGAIFEFVPIVSGGEDGFALDFIPTELTPRFSIQSLSLSQASKSLGRDDESWLLQVAVNLRIVETHFATGANKQMNAAEMSHLQMDIKLRKVQIDALFLAHYFVNEFDRATKTAIISVEAKQGNQRILVEQIARQVHAAFSPASTDLVIPVAISAIRNQGVYVVEFKAVERDKLGAFERPEFHRDGLYILEPAVPGI